MADGSLDFSGLKPLDDAPPKDDALDFGGTKPLDFSGTKPVLRDTGVIGAGTAGLSSAVRGAKQTGQMLAGEKPEEDTTDSDLLAAQPMEWGDFMHPTVAAKKAIYGLAASAPSMAAFVGGAAAGSAAVGGPETPWGAAAGLATGAVAAGAASAAQALGPAFARNLKMTPDDPDGAYDRAIASAAVEGGVGAIGFAAFGWSPFRSMTRGLLFKAFGVADDAALKTAADIGASAVRDPEALAAANKAGRFAGAKDVATQALAVQPAVAAAGTAAQNVVNDRPIGEGVAESIPGAIIGTAAPAVAHGLAHLATAPFRGRGEAAEERPPSQPGAPPPGDEAGAPPPVGPRTGAPMPAGTALGEIERIGGEPPTPDTPEERGDLAARKKLEDEAAGTAPEVQTTPPAEPPAPPAPPAETERPAAVPEPKTAAAEPVAEPEAEPPVVPPAPEDLPRPLMAEAERRVTAHPTEGTAENPVTIKSPEDMEVARRHVDIDATQGQKEAGVYKKGHIRWQGMDGAIETPMGAERHGLAEDGTEYTSISPDDYGYFKKTEGADGDQLDAHFGPNPKADNIYVIDQNKGDGSFDEHKAMAGYNSEKEAIDAYKASFSDGSGGGRIRAVTPMPVALFKRWLKVGDLKSPLAGQIVTKSRIINDLLTRHPDDKPYDINNKGPKTQKHPEGKDLNVTRYLVDPKIEEIADRYNISRKEAAKLLEEITRRPDTPIEVAKREREGNQITKTGVPSDDPEKMSFRRIDADRREERIRDQAEWAHQHLGLDREKYPNDPAFFDAMEAKIKEAEDTFLKPIHDRAKAMGVNIGDRAAHEATEAMADGKDMDSAIAEAGEREGIRMEPALAEDAKNSEDIPDEWKDTFAPPPELAPSAGGEANPPGAEPAGPERQPEAGRPESGGKPVGDSQAGDAPAEGAEPGKPSEAAEPAGPAAEGAVKHDPIAAAWSFAQAFAAGRRFESITQARKFAAEKLGMDMNAPGAKKALDEIIEHGVVIRARQIVDLARKGGDSPQQTFDALVDLYRQQPKLAERNTDSSLRQAYSTPAPLAYLASHLAGIDREKIVYEPTAGTGMLLVDADDAHVMANEIDPARRAILEDVMPGARITGDDAVTHRAAVPADVVIANPPFGKVLDDKGEPVRFKTDKYVTKEVDHAIVLQALKAMKDDGSAVLIIGGKNPMGERTDDRLKALYNSEASRGFFKALYDAFNVVDHFTVDGKLYDRQGASWPIDIIRIQGRGKSDLPLPGARPPRFYDSFDDLKGLLDGERRLGSPGERPDPDLGHGPAGGDSPVDGVHGPDGGPRPPDDSAGGPGKRPASNPDSDADGAGHRPPAAEGVGGAPDGGGGTGAEQAGGEHPREPVPDKGPAREPGSEDGAGGSKPSDVAESGRPSGPALSFEELRDLVESHIDELAKNEKAPNEPKPPEIGEVTPSAPPKTEEEKIARRVQLGRDIASMFQVNPLGFEIPPEDETRARTDMHPDVDPEKYARLQPKLAEAAALTDAKSGEKAIDIIKRISQALHEIFGVPYEKIRAMSQYLAQFIRDAYSGLVKLSNEITRRRENEEKETQYQVRYSPMSDAEAVGTLVPVNMQAAISRTLQRLQAKVGNIDDFVAKELGYSREEVIGSQAKKGYFSAEQVDALALAISNVDRGAGFIIGDQTGVGKGRFVAGMMRYAMKKGLTPIFMTENAGLYADMFRDLRDIGMPNFKPLVTNADLTGKKKIPLGDNEFISSLTPAKLTVAFNQILKDGKLPVGYDALFTNYSQMQYKADEALTVRHPIFEKLAPNSMIVMDESHEAGGTETPRMNPDTGEPMKGRADFARELLGMAQGAVYSSATYAKNPSVMSLYFRTDMPLAVDKPEDLAPLIKAGGVPLQQVVANMLVEAGQYMRRERTYDGVEMTMKPTPVNTVHAENVSSLLRNIFEFDKIMTVVRDAYGAHLAGSGGAIATDNAIGNAGITSTGFSSIMHNIVGQSLLALKADQSANEAISAWKRGEKPIIALSNTFGSLLNRYTAENNIKVGDSMKDLSFNRVFDNYLRRTREVTIKDAHDPKKKTRYYITDKDFGDMGFGYLAEEYKKVAKTVKGTDIGSLPGSPLDYIKGKMRDAGMKVGEITGRGLVIDDGVLTKRDPSAAAKKVAMNDFNSGKLDSLVINAAGSTGFSLHASVNYHDLDDMMRKIPARQRHMLLLQADPNIDTFMQILGRIHRTGQIIVPKYTLLASDLPAEKRPSAVLMRKMASLNANTSATRDSAVSVKQATDFMNQYGDEVVLEMLHDDHNLAGLLDLHVGAQTYPDLAAKFTGRLAILPIAEQDALYDRLEKNYGDYIDTLNRMGQNALEAKTIELDAKTIDRTAVTEDKGIDSPFAKPAYMERVSAARIGKPMTIDEVTERTKKLNGIAPEAAFDPSVGRSLARKFNENVGREVEIAKNDLQAEYDKNAKVLEGLHSDPDNANDERIKAKIGKAEARAHTLQGKMSNFEDAHKELSKMIDDYAAGRSIVVKAGSGDDAETFLGYTMGITKDGKVKNPLGLSGYTAHVAVADGSQELNIPLSKLAAGKFKIESALPQLVKDAFENGQAVGRENRNIVTGNLLAGFAKFVGRGMITMYRDSDGQIRQGILLPRSMDPSAFLEKQPVVLTAHQAKAFIDELAQDRTKKAFVSSTDSNFSVEKSAGGQYIMKAHKREGTPYYLNQEVKRILGVEQFTTRGNSGNPAIATTFDADKVSRILQVYADNLGTKFKAEYEREIARRIAGVEEKKPASKMQTSVDGKDVPPEGVRIQPWNDVEAWIKPTSEYLANEEKAAHAVEDEAARLTPGARTAATTRINKIAEDGTRTRATGVYNTLMSRAGLMHILAWSLESKDPVGTVRHEGIHYLRAAGFIKDDEWATLEKAAKDGGWIEKQHVDKNYPDASHEAQLEEAIASHFAEWRRSRPFSSEVVNKLYNRIDLFLRRVAARAREIFGAKATSGDIMTRIEEGKTGRRTVTDEPTVSNTESRFGADNEKPLIETPEASPEELAARQRKADKDVAEAKMAGRKTAAKPQESADELPIFGGKRQGSLFESNREETDGPLGDAATKARDSMMEGAEKVSGMLDEIKKGVAPMAVGSDEARAIASDYAQSTRLNDYEAQQKLRWYAKEFKPDQLKKMWDASDEQSVAEQEGRSTAGIGLDRLNPAERAAVMQEQAQNKAASKVAIKLGMMKGEGLPSYVPRMAVRLANAAVRALEGGKPGGPTGVDHFGSNLRTRTAQMLRRKYLTAEETEAAMKAKLGEDVSLVRDIRSLVIATRDLQKAIAGRILINKIRSIGNATGRALVAEGEKPNDGYRWFTVADHPAFMQRRPAKIDPETGEPVRDSEGNVVTKMVPLFVRGDFEGPLKAVLSRDTSKTYQALMSLKAKTMAVVMYSPFIHNAVEWGRALPALPGKVLTFRVYRDGGRARQDPATMREAIMGGMAAIGVRGGAQDISSVLQSDSPTPGRSFTAKLLGAVPGLFDPRAGDAVKRTIDKMGDFYHNTLLWDRVADLQAGLYVNFRDQFIKDGFDRKTAVRKAAHEANRFAGALPVESMSGAARGISNILFFSRSFTFGNLGVMKDAMTGLPLNIQAQIKRDSGELMNDKAVSAGRRKALAVIATDIGLMYVGNALLQSAISVLSGNNSADDEAKGYWTRLQKLMKAGAENPLELMNPLNIFHNIESLTPQADNEPGKQNRIKVGHSDDKTADYGRNPTGKIGEEMIGWLTGPLDMFRRKEGTLVRPAAQVLMNTDDFGHQIYDPYANTTSDQIKNVGRIVEAFLGNQIPLQSFQAARDMIAGRGDPTVNAAQVFGPLAGITFSKGYPGGEQEAMYHYVEQKYGFMKKEETPALRRMIEDGDSTKARARMTELGFTPQDQNYIIRATLAPRSTLTGGQNRRFGLHATPDEKDKMAGYRAGQ